MKETILFISLIFNINTILAQNNCINIDTINLKYIERIDLSKIKINCLRGLIEASINLSRDTISQIEMKGRILLDIISDYLDRSLKLNDLNPKDPTIKKILEILEDEQYLIYQPKPSNFEKLQRYFCEGRYAYIYRRASNLKAFYPLLLFSLILFCVYLKIIITKHTTKYQQYFKKTTTYFIIITLIFIIGFKYTCC